MRILFGTFSGRSGVVDYEEKNVVKKFGEARKMGEIAGLGWINEAENEVAYLHKDGDLILTSLNEELKINGTSLLDVPGSNYTTNSLAIDVANQKMFTSNLNGKVHAVSYEIQPDNYDVTASLLYTSPAHELNKVVLKPGSNSLLLLANKCLPALLDTETATVTWKPKNAPRDYLDLEAPINDLDAAFGNVDPNLLVTSTAHSRIRSYDLRKSKKRPITDWELKQDDFGPIGCVELSLDDSLVFCGNHNGNVYALDRRSDMKMVKKWKEGKGAVTSLAVHREAPYLCSVALDRYLRIYNVNTFECEWNCCLLQRTTDCKFSREGVDLSRMKYEEKDPEDDYVKIGGIRRPRLFRDKVKDIKELTHNRIKLPYDKQVVQYNN